MSDTPTVVAGQAADSTPMKPSLARRLAARPQIALMGVLLVLILITGLVEPAYLSVAGLRNSLIWAIPIGILAAGQTILMLTGGIDLSIAMIATASAYVTANQSDNGTIFAIGVGLLVGFIAGSERYRCWRVPGEPVDHDYGDGRHIAWPLQRMGNDDLRWFDPDERFHALARRWELLWRQSPLGRPRVGHHRGRHHSHAAQDRVRTQSIRPR